jgi:hypothetical protein
MNELQLVENHILIRETVGYEIISKIDVLDLPEVFGFLKIVNNYIKMSNINNDST